MKATPHQTTDKSPAEVIYPNKLFLVKLHSVRKVKGYHGDETIINKDALKKVVITEIVMSKNMAWKSSFCLSTE